MPATQSAQRIRWLQPPAPALKSDHQVRERAWRHKKSASFWGDKFTVETQKCISCDLERHGCAVNSGELAADKCEHWTQPQLYRKKPVWPHCLEENKPNQAGPADLFSCVALSNTPTFASVVLVQHLQHDERQLRLSLPLQQRSSHRINATCEHIGTEK